MPAERDSTSEGAAVGHAEAERHRSLWLATVPGTRYPSLDGDARVDVAVVGGGIVGVLTALLLKEAGKSVALVEARRLCEGTTGHTTAKLTSQHGLKYDELANSFGGEKARLYAEANEAAIDFVERRVRDGGIECDFRRLPAYVWAETEEERRQLDTEAEVARSLGLSAEVVDRAPLPVASTGALRFAEQAQFHPLKFLLPLAGSLPGDGSHVFERTVARRIERGAVTASGGRIEAEHVVLATHLPFDNTGVLFARAFPYRGYVIAAPIEPTAAPEGVFLNAASPTRSVRTAHDGEGQLLLVVAGDGHKAGTETETARHYRALEDWARRRFPLAPVRYAWSTQDYYSVDRVPFVGRLRPGARTAWAATGFGAWGMTNGVAAARVLADAILARDNPWGALYDPARPRSFVRRRFVRENLEAAGHFVGDRVRLPGEEAAAVLEPGEGVVIDAGGEKLAVSRGDDRSLAVVSAVCTHLRCIVRWNAAERSWDCPCHGSRFTSNGAVLEGPALTPLPKRTLGEGGDGEDG